MSLHGQLSTELAGNVKNVRFISVSMSGKDLSVYFVYIMKILTSGTDATEVLQRLSEGAQDYFTQNHSCK